MAVGVVGGTLWCVQYALFEVSERVLVVEWRVRGYEEDVDVKWWK